MDSAAILNPIEEVKKLQEMVRNLERQNEELRKGGQVSGLKQAAKEGGHTASTESLIDLADDQQQLSEQTWLHRSSKFDGTEADLDLWLLRFRSQLDLDFQQQELAAVDEIASKPLADQRQLNTRTFTRPKKRLMPLLGAKSMNSDLAHSRNCSQENLLTEASSQVRQSRESSLPRYNLDSTFQVHRSEGRSTPDRLSNGRLTPSGLPRSRLESPLNRTFNIDHSHDHLDEDQNSSASDSSFSSSHRAALTAGEVKTLARMQEESLKCVSTPAWNTFESRVLSPELPSPITRSTEDFHSDHSSRSSAVGDSLHSSPSGSPYGSNQTLTKVADGMLIGSNETLDRPPRLLKHRVEQVSGLARPVLSARSRGSSLIKPQCLVRPVVKSGESAIPRPQGVSRISRIPAPKTRIAAKSQDWMDGCY
ncbi:uncharacterized protein LOC135938506 isoform X1 [Cloeon dipterum]|uniref:uncharacterized protein LOC135938506 isoform X1 n=1 Tax=Cloeon dipterum TaxID=197152 RepID=UPI00321FEE68